MIQRTDLDKYSKTIEEVNKQLGELNMEIISNDNKNENNSRPRFKDVGINQISHELDLRSLVDLKKKVY